MTTLAYIQSCRQEDGVTNVFGNGGIEKMHEIEDTIFNMPGFQDFCLKDDDGNCLRPRGITRWAYPTVHPTCNTS